MKTHALIARERHRGFGEWVAILFAVLLILLGLAILGGGVWLIALGGSWYYALAGLGLIASGGFILAGSPVGLWIYFAVYGLTIVWALWEVGLNGWALVPRVVAPSVLALIAIFLFPVLSRSGEANRAQAARRHGPAAAAIMVMAIGGGAFLLMRGDIGTVAAPLPEDALAAEPPAGGPEDASDSSPLPAPAIRSTGEDWPVYGGTNEALRYSPLAEITPANVGNLERVWEYRTGDMPTEQTGDKYSPETTPIKIGDTIYLCSAMNIVIALDAATGKEEWRFDPGVSPDAIPYGATCRGVAYYEDPEATDPEAPCAARVIETTLDARMIAVDARLGQPCADFGIGGEISLENGIGDTVPGWYSVTAAPTIVRGIVVVGAQVLDGQAEDAPSGVVRGYDAITGELAWAWDLGNPELTGEPEEGEVYTRGTPNMWTTASGDEELGLVYLPLGNSSVDYYGANRSAAENEFATSLVAIDVATGEPAWHFQTVHYDVWDYDLGSQVSLIDFPADDGPVPALVLPSKQGDIYILDRRTGESLFPVEERPVPSGGVEPENLSPTQPFSDYATLAKPPLREKDMWGMSPLDQLVCRIQFRQAAYDGMYTPPTVDRRFIQYPGYNGGSDWGSVAVDTERGILVANYNDMPNFNRLLTREEADERGLAPINVPGGTPDDPQAGAPYAIDVNAGWRNEFTGLMCKQPPYGGITAIDLATGETLWDQPIGTARKNGPFGIPSMLPFRIGTPNNGGPVVTAGGLIFIAAATDDLIRAIDIETGEVVWKDALPAGGQANPITFEVGGRQYVVMMAGGHHFMETPAGDYVIAYALPPAP